MLEIRIPPDKCTMLNIAVTYHGKECQYTLPYKEPPNKFKVLNNTDYSIYPQKKLIVLIRSIIELTLKSLRV